MRIGTRTLRLCTVGCLALVLALGCSDKDEVGPEPLPRPVSAIVLETTDPSLAYQMTGSVESWKQEDVGFEVAGRVTMVVERGTDVLPKSVADEAGAVRATLLARLDTERYESHVESAAKKKDATVAQAAAQKADIDYVLKEQVRAAEADHRLALADLGRMKQLVKKGVNSEADLEQAEAKALVAEAEASQLKAQRIAKTASWEATKAQVAVNEQTIKDAQRDLRNCTLYAPFGAEVSEVHVIPGAYVQPGTPAPTRGRAAGHHRPRSGRRVPATGCRTLRGA